jgi:hypothetical protein
MENVMDVRSDKAKYQVPSKRGRPFEKGNPGRPRGAKNRRSVVAAALLAGEEDALIRRAVELAIDGDVPMLKFLLTRILPRERPVNLDLPQMEFADDAVEALGAITQAIAEGRISPSEGAALATVVNSYARAIDIADVVKRLEALEREARR